MAKSKPIMQYYPFDFPRIGHKEALEQVQLHWDNVDVVLLISPTGSGKTGLRRTIAYWLGDAVMTTITNSLIDQELRDFPWTNSIKGKANYSDLEADKYAQDLINIKRRGHPSLMVIHSMIAHRAYKSTLIADEGHKLISINQELMAKHIWRKNVSYPSGIWDRRSLENWLKTDASFEDKDKFIQLLATNDYMIKREKSLLRGKYEDCIQFIPMNPPLSPAIASSKTKIVLLSATLSHHDVEDLGISRGSRVLTIEVPSPIPPENRRIVREYVGALNYRNLDSMAPAIASKILSIAKRHPGKRGFVHVTYGLSNLLQKVLGGNSRFIFHDKYTSKDQLKCWLESTGPGDDRIFIGAGFAEGLDLAGADFPYQIIAKINWPSLADTTIKKKAEANESWYLWSTLKDFIQMTGRICRGPEDIGTTYVLDSTMTRLITDSRKHKLIPKFLEDVLDI